MELLQPVAVHRWFLRGEDWAYHPAFGNDRTTTYQLAVALDCELKKPRPESIETFHCVFPGRGQLIGVRAADPSSENQAAFRGGPPTILRVVLVPFGHRLTAEDHARVCSDLAEMWPIVPGADSELQLQVSVQAVPISPKHREPEYASLTPIPQQELAPTTRHRTARWAGAVSVVTVSCAVLVAAVASQSTGPRESPPLASLTKVSSATISPKSSNLLKKVTLEPTETRTSGYPLSHIERDAISKALTDWGLRASEDQLWTTFAQTISQEEFQRHRSPGSKHPLARYVNDWSKRLLSVNELRGSTSEQATLALRAWLTAAGESVSEKSVPDLVERVVATLGRWPDTSFTTDDVNRDTVVWTERFLKSPPEMQHAASLVHHWLRDEKRIDSPFDPKHTYSTLVDFALEVNRRRAESFVWYCERYPHAKPPAGTDPQFDHHDRICRKTGMYVCVVSESAFLATLNTWLRDGQAHPVSTTHLAAAIRSTIEVLSFNPPKRP